MTKELGNRGEQELQKILDESVMGLLMKDGNTTINYIGGKLWVTKDRKRRTSPIQVEGSVIDKLLSDILNIVGETYVSGETELTYRGNNLRINLQQLGTTVGENLTIVCNVDGKETAMDILLSSCLRDWVNANNNEIIYAYGQATARKHGGILRETADIGISHIENLLYALAARENKAFNNEQRSLDIKTDEIELHAYIGENEGDRQIFMKLIIL